MDPVPVRIAFLQHSATDVPGVLGTFAVGLGLEVAAFRADHGASALPGDGTFDLLVVMGSIESVTDDTVPWIGPERRLVAGAVGDGVPVLGVCFGGQLLAQVLGGTVAKASRPEVGWRLVDTVDRSVVPAGPWLDWHEDCFTCPPGAEPLASTEVSLHAFVQGPHTGVQFHPEVTLAVVEGWIGDARERSGLADDDVAALRAGFDARGRGPDALSRALFQGWLARTGAPG
jgi:GMP synthase-like glutamine amidotransferase